MKVNENTKVSTDLRTIAGINFNGLFILFLCAAPLARCVTRMGETQVVDFTIRVCIGGYACWFRRRRSFVVWRGLFSHSLVVVRFLHPCFEFAPQGVDAIPVFRSLNQVLGGIGWSA